MKYKIVKADTAGRLAYLVSLEIIEGWEPLGGVCFQPYQLDLGAAQFLQAMIKKQ